MWVSITTARLSAVQCLLLFVSLVEAQYIQNYTIGKWNNQDHPFWRREPQDIPQPVIIPNEQTILVYNCHYMKAICLNARRWLATPRGLNLLLSGALTPKPYTLPAGRYLFGYDIRNSATDDRRRRNCPSNWNQNHLCPEPDQPDVMPGPWFTTSTENQDPLQVNEIAAERDLDVRSGQIEITRRSGLFYSCEEFPAASFVEGGTGTAGTGVVPEGDGGTGSTYCAPMMINKSCTQGIGLFDEDPQWSEQNWQGQAHQRLARILQNNAQVVPGNNQAIIFTLALVDGTAGDPPTKVMWGTSQETVSVVKGTRRSIPFSELSSMEKLQHMVTQNLEELSDWNSIDTHVNASHSLKRAQKKSTLPREHQSHPSSVQLSRSVGTEMQVSRKTSKLPRGADLVFSTSASEQLLSL
ncbi:hypothetical protein BJ508DRAFT_29078 [Ascobolus immersus RN42]|uniref:Uncharacterized protein n=1 Tax=Ascobolus immersus RN42 TaxID=1160509 RepID=A0A3N4HSU8_ASCIM|nr:hypothetical protein BJ508DRAFT_29078 [Ascobolus immersus RN42]